MEDGHVRGRIMLIYMVLNNKSAGIMPGFMCISKEFNERYF
jgi:hypothetical protein